MSYYPAPIILDEVFNIANFIQSTTILYAKISYENIFSKLNTFLNDVIIKGTLIAQNININGQLLDSPYYYFTNLKSPIQDQLDSFSNTILNNGNVVSTVSVAPALTLPPSEAAFVTNLGTNVNAVLQFGIPMGYNGADAVQPSFAIGDVTSSATPSVTLTGSKIDPVLNFH